ncbi:hypothetical protein [Flavobacterium psychrotolerans]|uniref:Uncharacterized protein n=1 Tax=Flavobacterium psychrotolerans TaxID=2169410 RepID=A0A2U1JHY5_9FLAO|nr:hypothetical protein [Flavobacterium psychrotolerans]PWA04604.1 hypothetical protein DB895_10090 [Flavobacterium psychrotolerans]
MKIIAGIVLFIFVTFLITPTVVCLIEKNTDISVFYGFSEEEHSSKQIKAIFHFDVTYETLQLCDLNSSLIHSENLSKHDKIASKIFIPPPEHV